MGTAVEVTVSGTDFDDVKTLHFDQPGLQATFVAPGKFKVAIAADTLPGICDIRASGKHGVSNPRAFAISVGLEEVVQKAPNHAAEEAQNVPFGCAVNGQFRGALDDFYRVRVKAGQRVIIEVLAERLDSEHDATLSVLAPDGREVGSSTGRFGRDPLVDFTAREEGEYLVRVWDFLYRGGSAYRLLLGTIPVIDAVLPGTAEPGKECRLTLIGRNLPGGKPLPIVGSDGKAREALDVTILAPAVPRLSAPVRSLPLDLDLFQHQVVGPHGASNPAVILMRSAPHLTGTNHDASDRARELPAAGASISATFDRYNVAHWYRVALKKGQPLSIDLACERLGGPGDPYVQIFDPKGQLVTELDDWGSDYGGACRCARRDPWGTISAGEDGDYRLVARNRSREGSPAHRYVLTVGPPRPDLAVYACWNLTENLRAPRPLLAGSSQALDLVVVKRDNFASGVTCAVEGLPPFVRCDPVKLPGSQDRGVLVFTADAGSPSWEGPIRIRCRATIGGKEVEREAWGGVMTSSNSNPEMRNLASPSRVARQVWLAVRPGPAPFTIEARAPAEVVRGKKLPIAVTVRRAAGFAGKVTLTAPSLPTGWKAAIAEIAAGGNTATVEVEVPGNASADRYSIVLRGEGQAAVRDKKETAVVLPSNPVTVVVKEK